MKEFSQLGSTLQSPVSLAIKSQSNNQDQTQFPGRFGDTRSSNRHLPRPPFSNPDEGVLSPQQQFEMQTALALTLALAKQSPIPKTLFEHNRGLALSMLHHGWRALGWETGQLYFHDTVRDCATFVYPDRPPGVHPTIVQQFTRNPVRGGASSRSNPTSA